MRYIAIGYWLITRSVLLLIILAVALVTCPFWLPAWGIIRLEEYASDVMEARRNS